MLKRKFLRVESAFVYRFYFVEIIEINSCAELSLILIGAEIVGKNEKVGTRERIWVQYNNQ